MNLAIMKIILLGSVLRYLICLTFYRQFRGTSTWITWWNGSKFSLFPLRIQLASSFLAKFVFRVDFHLYYNWKDFLEACIRFSWVASLLISDQGSSLIYLICLLGKLVHQLQLFLLQTSCSYLPQGLRGLTVDPLSCAEPSLCGWGWNTK